MSSTVLEEPVGPDAPVVPADEATPVDRQPAFGMAARLAVLIALTIVAYRYSLGMLMRGLGVDSPLAYLGLVPPIALGLGLLFGRPRPGEPTVHDRYLDRIIGIPLLAVSLIALVLLPARLSTFFWVWRVDLLFLPLFVAGLVALLFGTRMLFRVKAAILFLFLAWPFPYRVGLARWLDGFTQVTIAAVGKSLTVVPLAAKGTGEAAFVVPGPAGDIALTVATSCSGANSLLGYLFVGGAVMLAAEGRRSRKFLWLAVGAALTWICNVVRILLIFVSGRLWGERVALEAFHPYIGLFLFAGVVLTMMILLPRFGLSLPPRPGGFARAAGAVRAAVPKWVVTALVLAVVAVATGHFDDQLREVDPVASADGTPQLLAFNQAVMGNDGFEGRAVDRFDNGRRFFGEDSDWTRYEFAGPGTPQLGTEVPVIADVVTTDELLSFSDFGVEACYRFHGFDVTDTEKVDLGRGQVASMLSWQDPDSPIRWLSLYWYWPVMTGSGTRYQRIVLLLNSTADGRMWSPESTTDTGDRLGVKIDEALRSERDVELLSKRQVDQRRFLVAFGRTLVDRSSDRSVDATQVGQN